MKVTDLMVGDWVSYCGFYNKVICVGQKVSMYNGKGTEFTTDPEYIRPIPLTEEILVKNGFDKDERSKYFHLYTLDMEGHWDFDISWSSQNGFSYEDIKLTYVHQLQHLLRLCGIEKEITL